MCSYVGANEDQANPYNNKNKIEGSLEESIERSLEDKEECCPTG